jgi:hypothetical protein
LLDEEAEPNPQQLLLLLQRIPQEMPLKLLLILQLYFLLLSFCLPFIST